MDRYRLSDYRAVRQNIRGLIKEIKTLEQPNDLIAHIQFIKEIKRELNDFLISRGYERKRSAKLTSGRKPYRKGRNV